MFDISPSHSSPISSSPGLKPSGQFVCALPVAAGLECTTEQQAQGTEAYAPTLAVELAEEPREKVTLCILRIGHTCATHGYPCMKRSRCVCTAMCAVDHVLISCPRKQNSTPQPDRLKRHDSSYPRGRVRLVFDLPSLFLYPSHAISRDLPSPGIV